MGGCSDVEERLGVGEELHYAYGSLTPLRHVQVSVQVEVYLAVGDVVGILQLLLVTDD